MKRLGEEERSYHHVQLSVKKCLRRSSSRNATIWKNATIVVAMQQFGRIIEWSEQQWRRWWWWYCQQNLKDSLDRTNRGDWFQCDMCHECICPNCNGKRVVAVAVAVVVVVLLDHKYWGQISIQLSTRTLNYAMMLSTFIYQS